MYYGFKVVFAAIVMLFAGLACGPPGPYAPPVTYPKNYVDIEWACFSPVKEEIVISINGKKYGGIYN